jgi:hypothetical protein
LLDLETLVPPALTETQFLTAVETLLPETLTNLLTVVQCGLR